MFEYILSCLGYSYPITQPQDVPTSHTKSFQSMVVFYTVDYSDRCHFKVQALLS